MRSSPLLAIRPAKPEDASAIAKVHVDAWRETYLHIVPQEHLDKLTYAEKVAMPIPLMLAKFMRSTFCENIRS